MKYLTFLIFFLLSVILNAQSSLSGKIINDDDGNPLANANIFLKGTNNGVISNSDGEFELSGTIKSNSILVVSFLGFKTYESEVSNFKSVKNIVIRLEKKILSSQTILVEATLGKFGEKPITYNKISRKEIDQSYINQDVPEFISYLPSTLSYSESGNGTGYNYLNIRGFDQRRISISVNGIPQNDPEDNNVYWVDMPDLLSSTEMIQVQRGAGSGVIGYPAIGGAINIITSPFSDKPNFKLNSSIGSFNTRKYSASFASGLINNKYSLYAKFSQLLSSGYRKNSWIDFKSYHLSAVRYDENITSQINIYGGPISDGLVYEGLPKFAIKDKNLRRDNYNYWSADNNGYTYTAERRPEEIENFSQPHFELLNEIKFSDKVKFNSALFLVIGKGFFDFDGSWADTNYLRLTQMNGIQSVKNPTNTLIRAQVENNQWGWIPRLNIEHDSGNLVLGAEVRIHNSKHWGSVKYANDLPTNLNHNFKYYYYEGGKNIASLFLNENYEVNDRLSILGELQLAYHKYSINNEKFVNNDISLSNAFLNPRLGLNYKLNGSTNLYLTVARVTREPRLKNYYDAAESSGGAVPQFKRNNNNSFNFDEPLVKPETMNDIELGLNYKTDKTTSSVNLYYMIFKNEIVKNGQIDRFGAPVTGNVDETIHLGIEASTSIKLFESLEIMANGTYGKNYISKGKTYLSSSEVIDLADNKIGGFPQLLLNGIIKFQQGGFGAQLFLKYAGEFYSDNYDKNLSAYLAQFPSFVGYSDNKVEAYFVMNAIFNYDFKIKNLINDGRVFVQINNIFDNLYAQYAIGKNFFPAAERNFNLGISLGL